MEGKIRIFTANSRANAEKMTKFDFPKSMSIMSDYIKFSTSRHILQDDIVKVISIPQNGKTVVLFKDGSRQETTVQKGDDYDINIGVALAIAKYLFGSNTKFIEGVKKKTETVELDSKGRKKETAASSAESENKDEKEKR